MNPMVTIHRFQFPSEAYAMKAFLESAGIPVVLINENLIGINPLMSNMLGGVKVTVAKVDEEFARELMKNYFEKPEKTQTPLESRWKTEFDEVETWCPVCEAFPVYIRKRDPNLSFFDLALFFLMIPFSFLQKKTLFCARCLHEWKR
jgi:Putative prokaryotic signal transducing protein